MAAGPHSSRAALQAISGGQPSWFGITVPFDLNTLLLIVSRWLPATAWMRAGSSTCYCVDA